MVRAFTLGTMERYTKGSGSMVINMGMECGKTNWETALSDSGFRTPLMDMVCTSGKMAIGMKENGDIP